jgi:hypothetical protein
VAVTHTHTQDIFRQKYVTKVPLQLPVTGLDYLIIKDKKEVNSIGYYKYSPFLLMVIHLHLIAAETAQKCHSIAVLLFCKRALIKCLVRSLKQFV